MRKEKFIYNKHTLQYEPVRESLGTKSVRIFGFLCASLFTGVLFTIIFSHFNATPREQALNAEIDVLKSQLELANDQFVAIGDVLDHLQERDAHAYRTIFGMDPIDKSIWEGGIGGHRQFEHLKAYENTGAAMANLQERMQRIKHQVKLQSESLDQIAEAALEKEHELASMPAIKPVQSDKLARGIRQLSGFGYRIHPIYKIPKMHYGIDFTAPRGTPIQATGAGVVEKVEIRSSGYGKSVVIDHGNGYKTLYGHMSKINVKKGQKVERSQVIGLVGSTGSSTAPHCHYEIIHNGTKINPLPYCMDNLTPEEYQSLVRAAESTNTFFDY